MEVTELIHTKPCQCMKSQISLVKNNDGLKAIRKLRFLTAGWNKNTIVKIIANPDPCCRGNGTRNLLFEIIRILNKLYEYPPII